MKLFNQLSRAFQHNLRWKGAEKLPSIADKLQFRKKIKRHYISSNQKLTSTQTHGSAFLDRNRKIQISKNEPDWLKIIDCFIDGYGFVISDHVNFSIIHI